MTTRSIFHLEKYPAFRHRLVGLNQVHNPEDEMHIPLLLDGDAWHELAQEGSQTSARAAQCRKALHALHAGFPEAPVHEQAAYLIRGINGIRPFAEANHRTAWDYVAELLHHSDCALLCTEHEGRELGNEVWERLQETHPDGMDGEAATHADGLTGYLSEWFHPRIGSAARHL